VFASDAAQWWILGITLAVGAVVAGTALLLNWRRAARTRRSGQRPLLRKKELCLATSRESAFALVVAAIRDSGGSIKSKDVDLGQVVGKYGATLRSWGQFLQVDLWDTDRDEQQLVCTSWPTQDFVVTEWGAGNILIDRFIEEVRQSSPNGTIVGERTGGHTIKE
jgi:hypothetical protein